MLRNIVRTSRWLARRKINILAPVVLRQTRCLTVQTNASFIITKKRFSSSASKVPEAQVDPAVFEEICDETLESLCDYFEQLVEEAPNLKGADITYSDGVLTVALGSNYGTYVINRQTPNKQIWLSSPVSGPKRYDLILEDGGYWIYRHDGVSLHKLLKQEITKIVENPVNIETCAHSIV